MMEENHFDTLSLYEALVMLKDPQEAFNFFKDLCTPQEINALQERWRVCQLLDRGDLSYRGINEVTGASLTTIVRVSRALKDEPYQGYRTLLDKIKRKRKK